MGKEQVDLVGYSMGGALALELAVAHPERVRRLVAGGFGAAHPLDPDQATALLRHAREGAPLSAGPAAELWAMVDLVPGGDRIALAACLAGFTSSLRSTDLSGFTGSALLFGGEDDPLAASLPAVAAGLPQAELVMLPRRSHLTALSAGRMRRQAIAFLDKD
jgi:non-heme chloroperoxidase